jgi:hypothetical protein
MRTIKININSHYKTCFRCEHRTCSTSFDFKRNEWRHSWCRLFQIALRDFDAKDSRRCKLCVENDMTNQV